MKLLNTITGEVMEIKCELCDREEIEEVYVADIYPTKKYRCTHCGDFLNGNFENYVVKNKYTSMDFLLKDRFDGDVYVQVAWIGEEKRECFCATFNNKLNIYFDIEIKDNKIKVKALQGDMIGSSAWFDLDQKELKESEELIEKLINN